MKFSHYLLVFWLLLAAYYVGSSLLIDPNSSGWGPSQEAFYSAVALLLSGIAGKIMFGRTKKRLPQTPFDKIVNNLATVAIVVGALTVYLALYS